MERFKISLIASVELDAKDAREAYELLRDFSDAIENGDGACLEEISVASMRRVRVSILRGIERLHKVPVPPTPPKPTIEKMIEQSQVEEALFLDPEVVGRFH
jgi:hypothetical protein